MPYVRATQAWPCLLEKIFHFLYLLLPMVHAFEKHTQAIYSSLRVHPGEWKYLLYSLGYATALSAFCYLLALFALLRKKHIGLQLPQDFIRTDLRFEPE